MKIDAQQFRDYLWDTWMVYDSSTTKEGQMIELHFNAKGAFKIYADREFVFGSSDLEWAVITYNSYFE